LGTQLCDINLLITHYALRVSSTIPMVSLVRKPVTGTVGFEFAEDPELNVSDITREDILSAYRVLLPTHGLYYGICKRNCRNNPRCLTGLGEKVWFEEEEEEDEEDEYGLEAELVRCDGIPSGLKNLGNTCYVNSFLQIWFHNSIFRQALYEWDPGEDPEEQDNESILDPELYEPRSKVASLQALFALMQYTKRKYVDPTEFICKLGLNPSVQQDAQEFSKLFVSLLEASLEHQTNQNIRGMIQKLFRGEYAYVTTCLTCKRESVRPSYFYELDLALAGNKNLTIEKCLEDFLRIEKMTGDEKYHCEGCQSKQDAIRCCKLKNLPIVLNLQLNRFQFDMQFGRKKKLNSSILYPQVLDMTKYSENAGVYHLIGVLMHVGPDANHGHYIAHIQELETGNWYKFSDEHVASLDSKLKARPIQPKKLKIQDLAKLQNSNNAYMLVYMLDKSIEQIREKDASEVIQREKVRRLTLLKRNSQNGDIEASSDEVARGVKRKLSEEIESMSSDYVYSNCRVFPTSLQQHLRNKIDKDNMEFDEEIEEKRQRRLEIARQKNFKKRKMKETYKTLLWIIEENEFPDEASFEFIPKSFLMDWFSDPGAVGPVENLPYLCVHGNLDVDRLADVKLCNTEGVRMLIAEYGLGEGPRLTSNRLCWTCVTNKARLLSLDYKLARDQDFIKHQLRIPTDGKGFWIGKKSLTQWKRLAKEALEDLIVREARESNYAAYMDYQAERSPPKLMIRNKIQPEIITIDDDESDEEIQHIDYDDEPCQDIRQTINFSGLKTKLGRIGTNVSLSSGNCTITKPRSLSIEASIMNFDGDSNKVVNGSEVKCCFEERSRLGKSVKPSCAVKPTIKPPKPSATVRPLNIAECLQAEAENLIKDDSKDDPESPVSVTPPVIISSAASSIQTSPRISLPSSSTNNSLSSPPKKLPNLSDTKIEAVQVPVNGTTTSEVKFNLCRVAPSVNSVTPTSSICTSASQTGCSTVAASLNGSCDSNHNVASTSMASSNFCLKTTSSPGQTRTECKPVMASKPLQQPDSEDVFNADIVCVHGNLRVEERCKQLISREVWFRLCTYFHNPTTFQFGVKPCGLCKEEASKEFLLREKCKEEANRQKSRLPDLFAGIERPKWSKPATKRVYLISSEFVHAWRAYCKGISSGKSMPAECITEINNFMLLCPHSGLFHSPSLNWENYPDAGCVMVREEEWQIIKQMFQVDVEIKVEKENQSGSPVLVSTPPVCHKCLKTKADAEHESRLNYKNQALFVTYLTQDEEIPSDELNDPEFLHEMRGGSLAMRRSTRRKRGRGEKQFVVSSDTLLRDLKVQIMEVFKVAPYDQILFLNGEYLNDNTQSLGSLGVLPGSSIFLKADQSVPCQPEDWANPHPEQGFKGTGLLSG